MVFKAIHWAVVAVGSVIAGLIAYKSSSSSDSKDPDGLEPAKSCPKGWFWDPGTKQCIEDLNDGGDSEVIGTADKAFADENGVVWSLYRYGDGSWEGTPLEAEVKYVKVFHEPTIDDLKAMIKGHASMYYANGEIKTGADAGDKPPYVPGGKCGAYYCWYLLDPSNTIMVPPNAQTSELSIGDVMVYWIGDEPVASDATYLAMITARVIGSKIEKAEGVSYPLQIIESVLLRGNPPTKLPPAGMKLDQWRKGLIPASLMA